VHFYHVYGLRISSDVAIPELLPSQGQLRIAEITAALTDRTDYLTPVSHWLVSTASPDGTPWLSWAAISAGYLLRFHGLADFLIASDGRHVRCIFAAADISTTTLRHLLIDHVLPRMLNLLGFDSLHATAVVIDNCVCAFVSEAGTGKSTLAASFHLAGYPAFCDDCLVLRNTSPITALPAYPGVRLWEPSFHYLGDSAAALGAPVAQYTSKTRRLGDAEGFPSEPLPIGCIYLLERLREPSSRVELPPRLDNLKPSEALPALMAATFPLDITDQVMLARHFRLLSRVAAELPIRRLTLPTDFDALPAARSLILGDRATA
jgi:hypothetical protein